MTPGRDLEAYFHFAPDLVAIAGADGFLRRVNPAFVHVLGYSEDVEATGEIQEALTEGGAALNFVNRIRRADGTYVWLSWRTNVDLEGTIYATARDVSAEVEQEQRFQEVEERYRKAFNHAGTGMAIVDASGRWMEVNRRLCTLVGYPEHELLQKTFHEITHPEDVERSVEMVRRLLAGECDSYEVEKRYIHRDGHEVWVQLNVAVIRPTDGSMPYFISQMLDLQARRHAEAKLARAEAKFRTMVEKSLLGTIIMQDERFVYANPRMADIFGYSIAEMMAAARQNDEASIRRSMIEQGLKGVIPDVQLVVRGRHKDGRQLYLEIIGAAIDYNGRPAAIATIHDVTARVEAERELFREKETMRSVVELQKDMVEAGAELGAILQLFARWSEVTTGADACIVSLHEGHVMRIVAGSGEVARLVGQSVPVHASLAGEVYRTHEPFYCERWEECPEADREIAERFGPQGVRDAVVPIPIPRVDEPDQPEVDGALRILLDEEEGPAALARLHR